MIITGNKVKNTGKKRKKTRTATKGHTRLSVVSVRISDDEKKRIDEIMRRDNIKRYSDVMKLAIQMIGVPNDDGYERAGMFH